MRVSFAIVALSARPDLAPLVADWKTAAFGYPEGRTREERLAHLLNPPPGPEATFVLLDNGTPIGTAGLSATDLDARPDLSPWLVGVFVVPDQRRRGVAAALVHHVEAHAAGLGIDLLWLYTSTAEALYDRLGWERVGEEPDHGRLVVLMRKPLALA